MPGDNELHRQERGARSPRRRETIRIQQSARADVFNHGTRDTGQNSWPDLAGQPSAACKIASLQR